jgi:hypothetical protein
MGAMPFTTWRLGFKQSSLCPIARAPQRLALDDFRRSLLSWHAPVPFTFQIQVSHQAQEYFLQIPPD